MQFCNIQVDCGRLEDEWCGFSGSAPQFRMSNYKRVTPAYERPAAAIGRAVRTATFDGM